MTAVAQEGPTREAGEPAAVPGRRNTRVRQRANRPVLGVRLGQLVAWQLVLVLLAVGAFTTSPGRLFALPAALLLLVATAVRWKRRWLYEWLLTAVRFQTRGKAAADTDGPLAALRGLLPELAVTRAGGRSRTRLGVVHDGRAWIALVAVERGPSLTEGLEPEGTEGVGGAGGAELPVARLAELLHVEDIAFESVQLLVQHHAAPDGTDPARSLAARVHAELNPDRVPLLHTAVVAVRFEEATCPEAVATRGGGEAGIRRALRRGAHRAVELLGQEGWSARVLDEAEITDVLAASAGLAPDTPHGTGAEEWTAWHGAGTVHASYWIRHLKTPDTSLRTLQELLATVPARSCALSVTCTAPTVHETGFFALLRTVGAAPDTALVEAAAARGIRLVRLDGDQGRAVAATLPLGRHDGLSLQPHPDARRFGLALHRDGVTLGRYADGSQAVLRLVRAEPVRLGVFLRPAESHLLVLRLLAAGFTVHVRSPRPAHWAAVMRAAGTDDRHLVIRLPGGLAPPGGSPQYPVAVIDEHTGTTPGTPRSDLAPWQLGITLHSAAPTGSTEELRRHDAVLVPRVSATTARQLATAYELPDSALRLLPMLPGSATALVLPGRAELLRIEPTDTEREFRGAMEAHGG
ncbi:type VII secretion protein EccE [Streptomyces sp. cf386]|uniref:type VII secretion protein EccE n=1 Tax=Streptomyces sp. cf386 TaxID=1761904 RepID=UPI00087E6210|nr:type VII secretion protein EccE [Streptomyces sp. cf386]SDM43964.1 type VII secretion protein EccE [Streptomyces sp. cf386]